MVKIALILFPGSNCERETALAVKRAGMCAIEFLWNAPKAELAQFDGYILIGGFSYEDRARAGIIAALDPIMDALKIEGQKGKPILGICNGAQILIESGLLDLPGYPEGIALTQNKRCQQGQIIATGYYNAWVNMRLAERVKPNAFTSRSENQIVNLPVAHGEGRFLMQAAVLQTLVEQGLIAFQYCDAAGQINPDFPTNPNGSLANIAAIVNPAGNIMAIMPHPERTQACDFIFESMHDFIVQKRGIPIVIANPSMSVTHLPLFEKNSQARELLVKSLITDNQALSVQSSLNRFGLALRVKRFIHWEIVAQNRDLISNDFFDKDILYSSRKERAVPPHALNREPSFYYLVRAKEDIMGEHTTQSLKNHYHLNFKELRYSVLWQFEPVESLKQPILTPKNLSFILKLIRNKEAHECYHYQPPAVAH